MNQLNHIIPEKDGGKWKAKAHHTSTSTLPSKYYSWKLGQQKKVTISQKPKDL